MKVLITGCAGQLGQALGATAPDDAQIIGHDLTTLDITDADAVRAAIAQVTPDLVINAAAYTEVDKAEGEEALALAINGTAVGHLAAASRDIGARFIHVSTDFIFDGQTACPYPTDAEPAPLSAYGRTKLAGEMAAGEDALIVRTAWVYAAKGANFVHTMLRLMRERDELRVVADQIGSPTWATSLATTIWGLADKGANGIYHHTDGGVASWYDFAMAIMEEGLALGLIEKPVSIVPIRTADYPTPARRPSYSVLDTSKTAETLGAPSPHWRVNLRAMLREVQANG